MSNSLGYLDPALPFEERVRDLINRMTLAEKISQMVNDCQAIPRLGIPAYNFWSEGLHGVAGNGRAPFSHKQLHWQLPGIGNSCSGLRQPSVMKHAPNIMQL